LNEVTQHKTDVNNTPTGHTFA